MKDSKKVQKNISDGVISILSFYRNNKSIIDKNEASFKEWLENNNLAIHYKKRFIASDFSLENGYMINYKKLIVDLNNFDSWVNFGAKITPKGQEYILNMFMEEE